jgi:hypothetical protein
MGAYWWDPRSVSLSLACQWFCNNNQATTLCKNALNSILHLTLNDTLKIRIAYLFKSNISYLYASFSRQNINSAKKYVFVNTT